LAKNGGQKKHLNLTSHCYVHAHSGANYAFSCILGKLDCDQKEESKPTNKRLNNVGTNFSEISSHNENGLNDLKWTTA